MITVFLLVLIFALILGNVFLSIATPAQSSDLQGLIGKADMLKLSNADGQNNPTLDYPENLDNLAVPDTASFSSAGGINADDNTSLDLPLDLSSVSMGSEELIRRIDRIERILINFNNPSFFNKKLVDTEFYEKLEGFRDFKNDSRIQIAALKQQLEKIHPAKTKNKNTVSSTEAKRIHELAYNIKKKAK